MGLDELGLLQIAPDTSERDEDTFRSLEDISEQPAYQSLERTRRS